MAAKEISSIASIIREKPSHEIEIGGGISEENEHQQKRAKFIQNQLEKMNEEQLARFDFYMRSHFKKNQMKQLIISSLQPLFKDAIISDEMAIVVGSLAKLYVGELIETATDILKSDPDEPPGLRRHHILEAYQQMCRTTNFDISNASPLFSSHESSYLDQEDVHTDPLIGKISTDNSVINELLIEDSS